MNHHWLRRPDRWARLLARSLLICALAGPWPVCAGCATSEAPGADAVADDEWHIMQAKACTNGTVVALDLTAGEGPSCRWECRFIDASNGSTIATSPSGWLPMVLRWGPGSSFIQSRRSPDGASGLYWAPSAGTSPRPLGGKRFITPEPAPWSEYGLGPHLREAVVAVTHAEEGENPRQEFIVVPVDSPEPSRTIYETVGPQAVLAGIVPDPRDPDGALVLICSPTEGGGPGSDLLAVRLGSGEVRWRIGLSPAEGYVKGLARSTGDDVIVMEQVKVSDPENFDVHTRVWAVDTREGQARFLAQIPGGSRVLAVPRPDRPHPEIIVGVHYDAVWRVREDQPEGRRAVKIVDGQELAAPVGARAVGDDDIEVYMWTPRCLWRCRLKDGVVDRLWGTPGEFDQPPRVLTNT